MGPEATVLENITVIEEEGLVKYVAETLSPYFTAKLQELSEHPMVGETRCYRTSG